MSSIESPRRFEPTGHDADRPHAQDRLREAHLREVLRQIRRHRRELDRLRDARDVERLAQEREVGRDLLVSLIRRQAEERRALDASTRVTRPA